MEVMGWVSGSGDYEVSHNVTKSSFETHVNVECDGKYAKDLRHRLSTENRQNEVEF